MLEHNTCNDQYHQSGSAINYITMKAKVRSPTNIALGGGRVAEVDDVKINQRRGWRRRRSRGRRVGGRRVAVDLGGERLGLADGVATLASINIQGPADQLDIVKPGTEALGTKYYATDGGFSAYA